jgi:putative transposase
MLVWTAEQARQLKQLQEENERLKKLGAELSLDKAMLADVVRKSGESHLGPTIVDYLKRRYTTSQRRACRLAGIHRRAYSYKSCRDPQTALRLRMQELAMTRTRYGYRKIRVLLKRETSLMASAHCTVSTVKKVYLYAIGPGVAQKQR